jgi:hypothetical protein
LTAVHTGGRAEATFQRRSAGMMLVRLFCSV